MANKKVVKTNIGLQPLQNSKNKSRVCMNGDEIEDITAGYFLTYKMVGNFPTSPFNCPTSGTFLPHYFNALVIQLLLFVLDNLLQIRWEFPFSPHTSSYRGQILL